LTLLEMTFPMRSKMPIPGMIRSGSEDCHAHLP
jgi:hypothetical protein